MVQGLTNPPQFGGHEARAVFKTSSRYNCGVYNFYTTKSFGIRRKIRGSFLRLLRDGLNFSTLMSVF